MVGRVLRGGADPDGHGVPHPQPETAQRGMVRIVVTERGIGGKIPFVTEDIAESDDVAAGDFAEPPFAEPHEEPNPLLHIERFVNRQTGSLEPRSG